ncbi:MAG: type III-A CRISPR-associated RAMP protein Csm5 [Pseudomonadota bacterium]
MNKQVMKCYLEVLAPVHVGCDEVYEPTGFSVDEAKRCLYSFDLMDFFSGLNSAERTKFQSLCQRGTLESVRDIYRFMQNRKPSGRSIALCEGFIEHYRKVLKMPEKQLQNEMNRFEISRTSYCSIDQRPYIPGSSVKGALRTAFLNKMAVKIPIGTPKGKDAGEQLENALLKLSNARPQDRVSLDPFRMVKVSDFIPVGEIATRIVYVVNEKKQPSDQLARGPYQILEVILPGAVFAGEISVEKPAKTGAVSITMDMNQLLSTAGSFYTKEKKREDTILEQIGVGIVRGADDDATLIRVGRHSGAESVTIEGHREIKIMQGRGKPSLTKDHATTLWFVSETQKPNNKKAFRPFGWAALSAITDEMVQKLEQMENDYQQIDRPSLDTGIRKYEHMPDLESAAEESSQPVLSKVEPVREIWSQPVLTWDPGKKEVTALFKGKKATAKGQDLVPEAYHVGLFGKKKKATPQKVVVEPYGNAMRIIEIA